MLPPGLPEPARAILPPAPRRRHQPALRGLLRAQRVGGAADAHARCLPRHLGLLPPARHAHGEHGHGAQRRQRAESLLVGAVGPAGGQGPRLPASGSAGLTQRKCTRYFTSFPLFGLKLLVISSIYVCRAQDNKKVLIQLYWPFSRKILIFRDIAIP
jgi:hypothetical protein